MEKTSTSVVTSIDFHSALKALEDFAADFPMDRLAPYQVERIENAASLLRRRYVEYEKEKTQGAPRLLRVTPSLQGYITKTFVGGPVLSSGTVPDRPIQTTVFPPEALSSKSGACTTDRRKGPKDRRQIVYLGAPYRRLGIHPNGLYGRRSTDTFSKLEKVACYDCYKESGSKICFNVKHKYYGK